MTNPITLFDYNTDWVLKEYSIEPGSGPGYLTREEVLAFYGTQPVDGMEIRHDYWRDCSPAHLKQLASDAGSPIFSYLFDTDLAVPPDMRPAVVDRVRFLLDRTAEMGAQYAFVLPVMAKQGLPLDDQRGWLADGLRECAEYGGSIGVMMICENCDWAPIRPLMGKAADCRDLCVTVDSPHFRLIADVGAPLFVEEDSLEALRTMLPYAAHVHLKNFRAVASDEKVQRVIQANSGQRYTGTLLDAGIVDIKAVVAELRSFGYEGALMVEYQGEDDPRPALEHNIKYLKGLLG